MSKNSVTARRRSAVLLATAGLSLIAAAGVAQAHVSVNPNTATQGSYTKVTFRVPNEEAAASTTTVEVDLPADNPIPSVSVKPVPGWTATATKTQLATPLQTDDGQVTSAVTKIVWTGGSIAPGQFQEFDVSLGPLPKTDKLVFKALQTYSDGSVVRWIDVPQAGQPEPDHPAPVLKLTPAAAGDQPAGGSATTAPGTPTVALTSSNGSAKADDGTARALAVAGLGAGVLGLGTAIVALRRKDSAGSSGPSGS